MMAGVAITSTAKTSASPGGKQAGAGSASGPKGTGAGSPKGTGTGSPKGNPTPAVLGTYGRVAAWLSKRVEVALGTVDLTLPQFRVLGILAEGSSAASGLADRLAVRRPSITTLIDGLEARGLVVRRQEDTDRRRVELRLTDEGARILGDADRAVDDYLASIAAFLPGKEESMALRSLELWGRALAASRQGPKDGDSARERPGR
jgi:DNA-binding MarR family transcriptional regulator